jgi:hypothetical protein
MTGVALEFFTPSPGTDDYTHIVEGLTLVELIDHAIIGVRNGVRFRIATYTVDGWLLNEIEGYPQHFHDVRVLVAHPGPHQPAPRPSPPGGSSPAPMIVPGLPLRSVR